MSLPIQRITHNSLHRFPRETDDQRNRTHVCRTFSKYLSYMDDRVPKEMSLSNFLLTQSKIKAIDCGAGEGVALDTLLDSRFGVKIKKVTGISLHSFNNVKELLKKHKNRMEWYLGDAIEILRKLPSDYDLITDVWGSYPYSKKRVALLKAMHQVLKVGGRAYIFLGSNRLIAKNVLAFDGQKVGLEEYLSRENPETFQFIKGQERTLLIITKTSKRCPPINFEVERASWASSSSRINIYQAKQANSLYPKKVCFKRTSPSITLRPLKKRAKIDLTLD